MKIIDIFPQAHQYIWHFFSQGRGKVQILAYTCLYGQLPTFSRQTRMNSLLTNSWHAIAIKDKQAIRLILHASKSLVMYICLYLDMLASDLSTPLMNTKIMNHRASDLHNVSLCLQVAIGFRVSCYVVYAYSATKVCVRERRFYWNTNHMRVFVIQW